MPEHELLNAPGFYILEWVILGGLLGLTGLVGYMFRDARAGRRDLYAKIDANREAIEKKIEEGDDKIWNAYHEHDTKCDQRHGEDQRWKGQVEGHLGISPISKQE